MSYERDLEQKLKKAESRAAMFGILTFLLVLYGTIFTVYAIVAENHAYDNGYEAGYQDAIEEYGIDY